MSLSEMILTAQDLPREKVACPEWGCDVWVRKATGNERFTWESNLFPVAQDGKRQPAQGNVLPRLLVKVLVDEGGKRIFSDAQADALGDKAGDVLNRLFEVAIRLMGIQKDGGKKKDASPPEGDSSSASPSPSAGPTPT